ncbi:MAG: hypothetical protein V4515_15225 [Chloroflexota bacterium]
MTPRPGDVSRRIADLRETADELESDARRAAEAATRAAEAAVAQATRLREMADELESMLVGETGGHGYVKHARSSSMITSATSTPKDEMVAARARGLTRALRKRLRDAERLHPFLDWIGDEVALGDWCASGAVLDPDGEPLKRPRVASWIKGVILTPRWFRKAVFLASGGKVTEAAWGPERGELR